MPGASASTEDTTKTGTTQQQQQVNPWDAQSPFLQQAFSGASNALGQTNASLSGFAPGQLAAFSSMLGYGLGNGGVASSSANAGGALTGAGANATGQGLYGLSNFTPGNTPSAVMDAANQYMNNPNTQGMIDAATLDARRAVNEGAMPQIERNANLSGNVNSNRTGIAQGIVERGLGDTVANTSANIRGQQFNTGLQAALSQLGGNDTNRLGALTALTGGGTNAVGTGVGANTGSVAQQGGLYGIANQGIAGQTQVAQAPFTSLQDFMNIIGSQNWGSSGTGTSTSTGTSNTTKTPSMLDTIGKIGGMGSSLMFG